MAIITVILVVVALLPLRVALVASSTIPITIFISLGILFAAGIELNTVTLAALIVVLGMIVDNLIVIVDSYLEKRGIGECRAGMHPYRVLRNFKSILSATLAIRDLAVSGFLSRCGSVGLLLDGHTTAKVSPPSNRTLPVNYSYNSKRIKIASLVYALIDKPRLFRGYI